MGPFTLNTVFKLRPRNTMPVGSMKLRFYELILRYKFWKIPTKLSNLSAGIKDRSRGRNTLSGGKDVGYRHVSWIREYIETHESRINISLLLT